MNAARRVEQGQDRGDDLTRSACRWLARLTVVGFSVLVAVAFPTSDASAHAVFVSATPQPGAALRAPPAAVRLVFSEPLDVSLSGIDMYASSGRPVQARSAQAQPTNPRVYKIVLPPLRPDRYTVVWHTVSAIDGHTRRGSYTFTVDRPDGSRPPIGHDAAAGPRAPPQVPTSGQAAGKWLGLAGLFLLAGSVLVGMLGARLDLDGVAGVRPRLCRLLVAGAGGLVAGTVGEVVSAWVPTGWDVSSLGSILSNPVGRWWEIRLAVTAIVVVAWSRSAWPGRLPVRYVQAIGIGALALSFAETSHGAASALPTLGLGYEFVHVLASSVWLGGAIAVASVWVLARRASVGDRGTLLRRYSVVAGVAVPAVLASGLGNAVLELGAVQDLVRSSYGVSLLAKLVAVLVLIGIAALNAVVLRPAWEAGRFRGRRLNRTIAIEAALGLAVLVPTAVLGMLAPSRPSDEARVAAKTIQARSDPARAFTGSTRVHGRAADVTVTPDAAGVNAVQVEVDGTYAASTLRVSITGPGRTQTVDLDRTGHDHDPETHTIYQGSLRIERSGTWQVSLDHAGGYDAAAPMVMPVSAPVAGSSAPSDSHDLAPWLWLIALAGAAVMVAAAGRAVPVRRRKTATLAVGGAAIVAAVTWAGTLTLGAASPAAQPTSWAKVRGVHPTSLPRARAWRIPTPGAGLMTPAIAPDGSVWVAEMDSNKLARLDPQRNEVQEFRFPGAYRETMGIAVAPDGRVWIAQEHAMALGVFDPGAGHYREFPIPGGVSAPVGITIGPGGKVWFTEMSGDKIGVFDPSTLTFADYPIPTRGATPYWLALAPDGRLWFTEFATGKVGVLDPRSGKIHEYPVPGHPNIPGIAVDSQGTVWFTTIQGSLFRLEGRSGRMQRIRLPVAGDYGVAVTPDGRVWVGRQGGQTVYAFEPATSRFSRYRLPPDSAPWWPTVDPHGRVWVTLASDRGNGLARLDGTR